MKGAWLGAIIALVALAPLAIAQSASGVLVVESGLKVEPSSTGVGGVLGAYWEDAAQLETLSVRAQRLHIVVYEFDRIDTPLIRQAVTDRSRSYDLTDVDISLAEQPSDGWVGYYGALIPTGSELRTGVVTLRPQTTPIGNAVNPSDGTPESNFPVFAYAPTGPYVALEGPVDFARTGDASIKFMGPTVRIAANENVTTLWTGKRPSSSIPGQTISRWILLTVANGDLQVTSAGPAMLALDGFKGHLDGSFSARDASGTITGPDGSYDAHREDVIFTGDLQVNVRPDASRSLTTTVDGTVTMSNLRLAPGPASPFPFGAAIGLTIVAVAVAGGLAYHRLKKASPPLAPDQYVDLAYQAADEGRFSVALEWILRARAIVPGNVRLLLDEAGFRAQTGDVDGALRAYDEASKISDTGEGDFLTAILLLQTGGSLDEAGTRLIRALQLTPTFALEIEDDSTFDGLRARRDIQQAMARALRAVDE